MEQIKEIRTWLKHQQKSTPKNDKSVLKTGYPVLFYGAANNNKFEAAEMLGKEFKKEVYRVDLSKIISKYIGETEKNLSRLFEKAKTKNWILFFDEADALFGKRSEVKDAHDRYANQEVSYLLQRLESYPGIIILSSNFKQSIDPAFIRRIRHIARFTKTSSST